MRDWRAYVRERLPLEGGRPAIEHDVVDDLAAQLEEAYRDGIARGLSDREAEAEAALHVADWPALARQIAATPRVAGTPLDRVERGVTDRAAGGGGLARLAAGVIQDLRFALKLARSAPGFAAVAVVTLAIGIGANTTVFGWMRAVLLNPLPGARASRMAEVNQASKSESYTALSYPDYLDLRDAATTIDALMVHDSQAASIAGPDGAERLWTELVSDNFFEGLGVTLAAGRGFTREEGRAPVPVVVVSERLARARFGGAASAVGRAIDINNSPFTIVGVAPEAFASGYTGLVMDAWLPIPIAFKVLPGADRAPMRNNHWLDGLARLAPGVTPERATVDLTAAASRLAAAQGATLDGRLDAVPLWRSRDGAQSVLGPLLLILMGMVAVVLLIACTNLANLLLSRASARRREFGIRLALGCSRGRLVRQLLTESLLLVSAAAVAAVVVQLWTSGLLTAFLPPTDLPIALSSRVDGPALVFTASIAFTTAVLFGLAPALQAGRTDLADSLRRASGGAGGRRGWVRGALVVAQVAFSMILLAAAGLFVRSLQQARAVDVGFRTDHMLLASVDLFAAGVENSRGGQLLTGMLDEIRALPGVESASLARRVPLGISTGSSSTTLEPEGYVAPQDNPAFSFLAWVGPDYFRTMGIAVLAGREFTTADRPDQPEGLVVNETFARRYWRGEDPIGRRVRLGRDWYPVVGVVADSKYRRLNESPAPFVYLATTWNYRPDVTLQVRTAGDPLALAGAVRAAIRRADPKLPVFGVTTLDRHVQSASFQQRLAASMLSALGAVALLLSAIGLYATMAYSVSLRTRELGARLALGATRAQIARLVLRQAAWLTALGLAIGLPAAAGAATLSSSLLVGVRPLDPATFAGVTTLLVAIALVAGYVPARRASRLDPLIALRSD